MVMRAQLSLPNLKLLTPDAYNQVFTMHGTTMIFLGVMPVLTGFGVYLIPLMIGAEDMAFPRLSAFAFWLQVAGGLLLYLGFATGNAPNAGWFSYAPLSEKPYSPGPGMDFWARPELRVFFTFAKWSESIKGQVGGDAFKNQTYGATSGVQFESWW